MRYFVSPPAETSWQMDASWFIARLRARRPDAKIRILNNSPFFTHQWEIQHQDGSFLEGKYDRVGPGIVLSAGGAHAADFALWFRTLVPREQELWFYDEPFSAYLDLKRDTKITDFIEGFAIEDDEEDAAFDFQLDSCGLNLRLVSGGGEQMWVDGLDIYEGFILAAKYVANPTKNPFVDDSNVPPAIQKAIRREAEDQFRQYAAIIDDPETPLRAVDVFVNDKQGAPYFLTLMDRYRLPGRILTPSPLQKDLVGFFLSPPIKTTGKTIVSDLWHRLFKNKWRMEPSEFIHKLRVRWPDAEVRPNENDRSYSPSWKVKMYRGLVQGDFYVDGPGVIFDGSFQNCINFALWFRSLAPPNQQLSLSLGSDDNHMDLRPDATAVDVVAALGWPKSSIELEIKRAKRSSDGGDYDRAIQAYSEVISKRPKNPFLARAFAGRATAFSRKREFAKAIEDLTVTICLEPEEPLWYVTRGKFYTDAGEFDKAIRDFDEGIRLRPEDAPAFVSRSVAYANKGDYDHAIQDLTEAIRLDPTGAEAFLSRGLLFKQVGKNDRASDDLKKAVCLDPRLSSKAEEALKDMIASE